MKKLIISILFIMNISNIQAESYIFKVGEKLDYKVVLSSDNGQNKQLGSNGICGEAQTLYTEEEPINNLCSTNYGNSIVSLNGYTYSWSCIGSPETETNLKGNDSNCISYKNLPLSDHSVNFYRVFGSSLETPYGSELQISQLSNGSYSIPNQSNVSLNISNGNIITLNQTLGSVYGDNTYSGYVISGIPSNSSFSVIENNTSVNVAMLGSKIFFNYSGKTVSTGGKITIKMNLNDSTTECGSLNNTYTSSNITSTTSGLCSIGQVAQFSNASDKFNWNCTLPSINKYVSCSAFKNPICGSSHGQSIENIPTELCSVGTPSVITENLNSFNWSCSLNNKVENCESSKGINLENSAITAFRIVSSFNPYGTRIITNNTHVLNKEYIVPNEANYFAYKIVNNNTIHLIQKSGGLYGNYTYNGYTIRFDKINDYEVLQNTLSIPIIRNGKDLVINYNSRDIPTGNTIIIKIK